MRSIEKVSTKALLYNLEECFPGLEILFAFHTFGLKEISLNASQHQLYLDQDLKLLINTLNAISGNHP